MMAGTLRPDWRKRGFLRGWTDDRYTFARYFSPLKPNRPDTVEQLITDNDIVLYDQECDPLEMDNLAYLPEHQDTVARLLAKLEGSIDTEIGTDDQPWVTERPRLFGYPTWRGDTVAAQPV